MTGYEEVNALLGHDGGRVVKDMRHALSAAAIRRRATSHEILQQINQNMLFADPPDHTRLRNLVNQAFTPQRVAGLANSIQARADSLLTPIADRGHMELMTMYALPLPVGVIMDLLGIPPVHRTDVQTWSTAIIAPGSRGLTARARRRRVLALVQYLRGLFEERRRQPQEDLLSDLVAADSAGDRLNETELISMAVLLIVTGHETVINLIGNGALALLRRPEVRHQLGRDRERWAMAVEELLRYDGPVETSTTRWAREDFDFYGHRVRRGDLIRLSLAAANRDPAAFDRPDNLDWQRKPNPHLAFGRGIHYCLGAPLARLEGRIALQTLFTRLPDLQLARPPEQLEWRSGVLFRGLKSLPLRWGRRTP